MLWLISITLSLFCLLLGVINWKRRRRLWGGVLIVVGLLVFVAPLPTMRIKVDLPKAARQ